MIVATQSNNLFLTTLQMSEDNRVLFRVEIPDLVKQVKLPTPKLFKVDF